jgi:kinetochore protein Mis12/MTW1
MSNIQRKLAKSRLSRVEFLNLPTLDDISGIPDKLSDLHASIAELPALDPAAIVELTQLQLTDPGKRQWETSNAGYLRWAVDQLLARLRQQDGATGTTTASQLVAHVNDIANVEDLKATLDMERQGSGTSANHA